MLTDLQPSTLPIPGSRRMLHVSTTIDTAGLVQVFAPQDTGPVRVRVGIALEMREDPLADNEIRDAVAIDIGERRSVRFGRVNCQGSDLERSSIRI